MTPPRTADEAVRNAYAWFDVNSGWAQPDDDSLAEWVADSVCRCPDDCIVAPEAWCEHGLAVVADRPGPGGGLVGASRLARRVLSGWTGNLTLSTTVPQGATPMTDTVR
jgi:hypothetical protein